MVLIILEITLCMLFFLLIYHLVIARTALHRFKRFYLLAALIVPITVPFIQIELPESSQAYIPVSDTFTQPILEIVTSSENPIQKSTPEKILPNEVVTETPVNEILNQRSINLQTILVLLYGTVSLILITRLVRNVYLIFKKFKASRKGVYQHINLAISEKSIAPFSFLNMVFISQKDFENQQIRDQLLTHEMGHIKQLHTIDIILLELIRALFWINPIYYFYGKAIRLNHEYLADSAVIKAHKNISSYQNLLLDFASRVNPSQLPLTSPFNYSITKKRFIMMTTKISKTAAILRISILMPLLALTTMSFTGTRDMLSERTSELLNSIPSELTRESRPDILPIAPENGAWLAVPFGETIFPDTEHKKVHVGIDIKADLGTPVRATASGTIEIATTGNRTYGTYIRIKHDDEYQTLYASLNELKVKTGERIEKGSIIGSVGKSIENSNTHLHYEVIKNGDQLNPQEFFEVDLVPKLTIPTMRWTIRDIPQRKTSSGKGIVFIITPLSKGMHSEGVTGFKYDSISYAATEQELTFYSSSFAKPIIKHKDDFNTEEIEVLNALRSVKASPTKRRSPEEKTVKRWLDPKAYAIWINNARVDNSEMAKYTAKDFSYYRRGRYRIDLKDTHKAEFRLMLYTEDVYQDLIRREKQTAKESEAINRELLKKIDF